MITIGISSGGTIKAKTAVAIAQALRDYQAKIIMWESCLVHQNRENIGKEFLSSNSTHLLFIDTDILFNPSIIQILLDRDKDIIGANYYIRDLPRKSTVKIHDENGNILKIDQKDGTFECFAVGTGFMLIKRKVFETLPHPWFSFEQDDKGNTTCGEDIYFCKQARKHGFRVFCDPNLNVKHLGDFAY